MADPSVAKSDPLVNILREMTESQQRQIQLLRGLLAFAAPLVDISLDTPTSSAPQHSDACDCEICGQYVQADQMSGFAWRHGAMTHISCLTAQMSRKL